MAEAEGDKHWKAARKLTSASLLSLRLKSDWEQAGPLYEKAAHSFRQAKSWDKAREAYEMAAKCAQHQDSPWHAAKHLEKAAEAARETKDVTLAVDYYKQASLAYREAGRATYAAEALSRGARIVEESSPEAAGELLAEAIEEIESEGKFATSGDLFRQAIGIYLRAEDYQQAVGMLLRHAAACDSLKAISSQCKAYLGAIVVWLYAENGSQTWAVYQDALEVEAFTQSEEAFAAEALLESYRSGDEEAVRKCVSSRPLFLDLDNQIARLAKKLPQGSVGEIARGFGGEPVHITILQSAVPKVSTEDLDEEDFT